MAFGLSPNPFTHEWSGLTTKVSGIRLTDGMAAPVFFGMHVPAGVVVGVDMAESVFQVCEADTSWRRRGSHRLSRTQLERWFDTRLQTPN